MSKGNFILMVVEDMRSWDLFAVKVNLPQLYGLVSRSCDQELVLILTLTMHLDRLEEYSCDVVIVGVELLQDSLLCETEKVDIVVHSRKCVSFLPAVSCSSETTW